VLLFAGRLPVLFCQLLQLRFSGLKLKVGNHVSKSFPAFVNPETPASVNPGTSAFVSPKT
jgi:hypothetical protein